MNARNLFTVTGCLLVLAVIETGCRKNSESAGDANPGSANVSNSGKMKAHDHDGHSHSHNGSDDHDHDHSRGAQDGHAHDHGEDGHHGNVNELGSVSIGGMDLTVAQAHGPVAAGMESHLVLRVPNDDHKNLTIRAWLGTSDRTLSYVGKAEYDNRRTQYDVHATAPDPLPEDVMWWIEIEKTDGTSATGSIKPFMDE